MKHKYKPEFWQFTDNIENEFRFIIHYPAAKLNSFYCSLDRSYHADLDAAVQHRNELEGAR